MPKYGQDLLGAAIVITLTFGLFYIAIWIHGQIRRRRP